MATKSKTKKASATPVADTHTELLNAAQQAVENLVGDTSVDQEQTVASLSVVLDFIETWIDQIEADLRATAED